MTSIRNLTPDELSMVSGGAVQEDGRITIADNPGEVDTITVYGRVPAGSPIYSFPIPDGNGGIRAWVRYVPNGYGGTTFQGTGDRYQGISPEALDALIGPLREGEERR